MTDMMQDTASQFRDWANRSTTTPAELAQAYGQIRLAQQDEPSQKRTDMISNSADLLGAIPDVGGFLAGIGKAAGFVSRSQDMFQDYLGQIAGDEIKAACKNKTGNEGCVEKNQ